LGNVDLSPLVVIIVAQVLLMLVDPGRAMMMMR
jgi:hypothetical protein